MGKLTLAGKAPQSSVPELPSVMLGDIAVGSSVFLRMNGSMVEHLVVNQGIPSNSSLYDSSCDGTWLIPKDIVETRQFNSATSVYYAAASIHSYLNGDYLAKFDAEVQNAIKQVKIPHITGTNGTLTSGANGLSTKCFLLGNFEVGCIAAAYVWQDGACLDFFSGINGTAANEKRIAYLNGAATRWWLRTPHLANYYAMTVAENGAVGERALTSSFGLRPAIILLKTAQIDGANISLKGAS